MARDRKPGMGVDSTGGPVVDPTANVLDLVQAANRRQDDLRAETTNRLNTELACVKEISNLRASHVQEISMMRADHSEKMAMAESKRLDAVRAVDVTNVQTAATASLAAIQRLAETTATNADNIRNAMTATATAVAQQLANTVGLITERISALEKSSYEGKGKSTITDPAMEQLLLEVKRLAGVQSGSAGKTEGINAVWLILVAALAILMPVLLRLMGK